MNQTIKITDEMIEAGARERWKIHWGTGLAWETASERHIEDYLSASRSVLTAALAAAEIPAWEPCEPEDIKIGDRYRVEHEYGRAVEDIVKPGDGLLKGSKWRYFRIPAKVEKAVWPTVPGLYEIEWLRDGDGTELAYMFGPDAVHPENSGKIRRDHFEAGTFLIKAIRKVEA